MTETDHDRLTYTCSTSGETVTITVLPQDTNQMATFNLREAGHVPVSNNEIQFQLNPGANTLQLVMDSNTNDGSYRVVVKTVQNETNNECVHVWKYHGNVMIKNFTFSC